MPSMKEPRPASGMDVQRRVLTAALGGDERAQQTLRAHWAAWPQAEHLAWLRRTSGATAVTLLEAVIDGLSPPAATPAGADNTTPSTGDDADRYWPTLEELLERPELLEPPAPVLPRLAWAGRATLLAAPDKSGKSTLAADGAAALTRGRPWLGEATTPGHVLWAGPDEHVGDTVRRLTGLQPHPGRIRLLAAQPPSPMAALLAILDAWPAQLVVVDSLAEWARITLGQAPDDGDAAGWGTVVRPLVGLAHGRGCGLLLLHHPRRADGQYRGSGEIAAAVDCLLEMRLNTEGEDPTLRRVTGRARWPLEPWSWRMGDGAVHLGTGGPMTLDARILAYIERNPGTPRTPLAAQLGVRKAEIVRAVDRLVALDALAEHEHHGGKRLYLPRDVQTHLTP